MDAAASHKSCVGHVIGTLRNNLLGLNGRRMGKKMLAITTLLNDSTPKVTSLSTLTLHRPSLAILSGTPVMKVHFPYYAETDCSTLLCTNISNNQTLEHTHLLAHLVTIEAIVQFLPCQNCVGHLLNNILPKVVLWSVSNYLQPNCSIKG